MNRQDAAIEIALVDDDKEFLTMYREKLHSFFREKNCKIRIDTFEEGASVKESEHCYNLYMLDIEMPDINGILLAQILREKFGDRPELIFVTAKENAVFDVFRYEALGFIRKAYLEKDHAETMEHFMKRWESKNKYIELKTREGVVYKTESEIRYAEVFGHEMILYCSDDSYHLRCTIEELKQLVKAENFTEPYKGYLVNCGFIKKLEPDRLILSEGTVIPLSKRNKNTVRKNFLQFLNHNR